MRTTEVKRCMVLCEVSELIFINLCFIQVGLYNFRFSLFFSRTFSPFLSDTFLSGFNKIDESFCFYLFILRKVYYRSVTGLLLIFFCKFSSLAPTVCVKVECENISLRTCSSPMIYIPLPKCPPVTFSFLS